MKKKVTGQMAAWVCVGVIMAWSHGAAAQSPSIYVSYYTPQFYMDYLVFYDEAGTPIYYDNDTAYSVPSDYAYYQDLVSHYQQNASAYQQWFEEVGYAQLNYRQPVAANNYQPMYYLDYPVFYDDQGRPIYYVDGAAHPVPATYAEYNGLTRHYRQKRAIYLSWYRDHGRRYRWYRRPIVSTYYQPLYHDGYVVYYDDRGMPFYYRGNQTVYIPQTYQHYNRYRSHYTTHRVNYNRWHREHGRRYQEYRRPTVYRRRVVNSRAPRASHGRAVIRVGGGVRTRTVVRPGHPGRPSRVVHPGPARGTVRVRTGPPPVRPGRPGRINCSANPGHPACRPAPRPGPQRHPNPPRSRERRRDR